jgi:pilus assembly protein CpaE
MIPAVIISPNAELASRLEQGLAEIGQVAVVRKLARYPGENEVAAMIRAHAPQIFFVDVASLATALRVAAEIEASTPGIQVVAFEDACDQGTLLELMRAGVREFVSVEQIGRDLPPALLRIAAALHRKPPSVESTDLLFSFLPSKPGVGCTTVALNTAVALAATPDFKTLLMDFDLTCGMIGFLLHLDNARSIVDAAEQAPQMDEQLWPRLVYASGGLDVLPAGRMKPHFRIEPAHIHYLLEFARRNYRAIVADLSGLMEKYSLELMQRSKRILLVCTPELPSLHLAREKLEYLRGLELESRVSVLLNRSQKRALMCPEEIERMIGLPVMLALPNDYRGVHKAFTNARPVDPHSDLGKSYRDLAARLVSRDETPSRTRRFVDYFSLIPARYSFNGRDQE